MKEAFVRHPATGCMIRQVALEPSDLAEMDAVFRSHLEWLSRAHEFIPGSHHLHEVMPKLKKIHLKIKDLQNYGIPSEIEAAGN